MRRWRGYLLLAAFGICISGCGRKETGSELLTETKEAVKPVTEAVERVKTDPPCEIIKTAVISNPSGEAERLVLENRENSRFARAAFEK